PFKSLCFLNYALMIRQDYDITSSLRRGALQFWYQSQMVNTRTDTDLSAAVQNALQTLLPQIREEIREEFRTRSGSSNAGGNPPPVTIHTWLEHFNKQNPYSFEKATIPVDAENWISHMEKIFDVMGCEDAFKTRLAVYKFEVNALAWWKAYKQAKGEIREEFRTSFGPVAAGTEEEQAKNFQWGLRKSTLNHLMCMPFTDVAQVANAARNYEILYERDDDGAERPDKRQKSGDRHQPTSQQSSHRNHGHNNDRHGLDRRGGSDNHRSSNNNYSGNNNRNFGNGHDQRNRGQQSNRSANSVQGPSEGYSYPVCTTCGRRHLGECRRAAGTCSKCGQVGHLQKDCKKNTTASTSGKADKKPGASGRVFAITEDHATKTSDTLESVVELLVPALSVFKLAICRRIARRTPLRV
nr:hypothetical protein [Tanacetum cinerariifolium]